MHALIPMDKLPLVEVVSEHCVRWWIQFNNHNGYFVRTYNRGVLTSIASSEIGLFNRLSEKSIQEWDQSLKL
jgi:hypothetical protein